MATYRAAVIGLGRMGSTFDDEMTQGIALLFIEVPSFEHVVEGRWRQEAALAARAGADAVGVMTREQVEDYVALFERKTRQLLGTTRCCTTVRIESVQYVTTEGTDLIHDLAAEAPNQQRARGRDEVPIKRSALRYLHDRRCSARLR